MHKNESVLGANSDSSARLRRLFPTNVEKFVAQPIPVLSDKIVRSLFTFHVSVIVGGYDKMREA